MKTTVIAFTLLAIAGLADAQEESKKNPVVVMKTSMGDITLELFADEAPKTVENFLDLAEGRKEFKDPATGKQVTRPYYDGLVFHRIIINFMIQGGCPLGKGTGGPGYSFEDEINADALGLEKLRVMDDQGAVHQWLRRDINNVARRLLAKLLEHAQVSREGLAQCVPTLDEHFLQVQYRVFSCHDSPTL